MPLSTKKQTLNLESERNSSQPTILKFIFPVLHFKFSGTHDLTKPTLAPN